MRSIDLTGWTGSAKLSRTIFGCFGIASVTASLALADVKVEQSPLGPDGDSIGCAVSPHGGHAAVLAAKGSRFVVLLDGVEGPKIEALLTGVYSGPAGVGTYPNGQIPVLFSNDGSHSAYIGKVGDEYIVFEDGKELCRGPFVSNGMANIIVPLEFSAGGKHLFFMNWDGGKYHVVVDGKPGAPTGIPQPLFVSPDGEHYAYGGFTNNSLGNGVPNWDVADGRQVNYIGEIQYYTGRNVLVSRVRVDNADVLVLNGKPSIKAYTINPTWFSPDGIQIAMVLTPTSGQPPLFTVDGKVIAAAQGLSVSYVYFSPDGKRWAALCSAPTGFKCMIIDGKKGQTYQDIIHETYSPDNLQRWAWVHGKTPATPSEVGITVPGFTADSSKFVYVASQGGRQFLVVDEDESNGFSSQQQLQPVLSAVGHRIGVIGIAPNGKQHVIIDGQEKEYGVSSVVGGIPGRCVYLLFTDDGSRYAMVNGPHLVVDGAALGGTNPGMQFLFSPDNKHVVYKAMDGSANRLFLDGKIIDSSPSVGQIDRFFFSPDSQHIFTLRRFNMQSMGTKDSTQLSIDGKPATHYAESAQSGGNPCNFEFSSDGVLSFDARTDGNLRLFRVTPPSDTNVDSLLAAAKNPTDKQ